MTGTVFHLMNSRGLIDKPFWSRMFRQSRPARDAEKLGGCQRPSTRDLLV